MIRKYGRLVRYALRQWPALIVILGLTAATAGVTALQPWPLKLLVDYALGEAAPPEWLRSALDAASLGSSKGGLVAAAALGSVVLFVLGCDRSDLRGDRPVLPPGPFNELPRDRLTGQRA